MALPTNILQQVQTYQRSELAYLQNMYCSINLANKKFKNFEKLQANLGDTVTFDLPPRFSTTNGLKASFLPSEQRVHSLTVNDSVNTAYSFNVQQFIYNVRDYMERFGKSAVKEIGTKIEKSINSNFASHTYRFYGDGLTAISSYGQLAEALALFRNYGSALEHVECILPDTKVPAIINTQLAKFTTNENDKIVLSWKLGHFSNCNFYQSNLLPLHVAGSVGQEQKTLTVVSTNDPTGANITQITFSGATANDPDAFKVDDLIEFQDGVSGQPNLRYATFVGHEQSDNHVQLRVTANAASNGAGQVTITINPGLVSVQNQNQNIFHNIVAGMQVLAIRSHRVGVIMAGKPLFLGMPMLPEEVPFPTANENDSDSGVAMRMYYGSLFGQNQRGFVHDAIWGSTMVDEYAMRICFPV